MLTSVLATAGALGIIFVLFGVLNPVFLVPFIIIGFGPLALLFLGKLFANQAPSANGGPGGGPATPSTRDASYEPKT